MHRDRGRQVACPCAWTGDRGEGLEEDPSGRVPSWTWLQPPALLTCPPPVPRSEHDLGEDVYDCVPCEDEGDDIYEDIIKVEVQQPMVSHPPALPARPRSWPAPPSGRPGRAAWVPPGPHGLPSLGPGAFLSCELFRGLQDVALPWTCGSWSRQPASPCPFVQGAVNPSRQPCVSHGPGCLFLTGVSHHLSLGRLLAAAPTAAGPREGSFWARMSDRDLGGGGPQPLRTPKHPGAVPMPLVSCGGFWYHLWSLEKWGGFSESRFGVLLPGGSPAGGEETKSGRQLPTRPLPLCRERRRDAGSWLPPQTLLLGTGFSFLPLEGLKGVSFPTITRNLTLESQLRGLCALVCPLPGSLAVAALFLNLPGEPAAGRPCLASLEV